MVTWTSSVLECVVKRWLGVCASAAQFIRHNGALCGLQQLKLLIKYRLVNMAANCTYSLGSSVRRHGVSPLTGSLPSQCGVHALRCRVTVPVRKLQVIPRPRSYRVTVDRLCWFGIRFQELSNLNCAILKWIAATGYRYTETPSMLLVKGRDK